MVRRVPSSRACGARPSSEWPSDVKKALRGKPRDGAKGGFLGGARSPRPDCRAVPKPRHKIINGGKRTPGGPMGRSSGGSKAPLAGVRSPPLRGGGRSEGDALAGDGAVTMRKAIFSEGRGLRVRMPRPNSSRGISSPEMAGRAARGPIGRFHDEARAFLTGVRSPPLRGKACPARIDQRGESGDVAKADFFGGTRSARPHAKAELKPRHRIPTGAFTMSRWPRGGDVRVGGMRPFRACGARPSAGVDDRRGMP